MCTPPSGVTEDVDECNGHFSLHRAHSPYDGAISYIAKIQLQVEHASRARRRGQRLGGLWRGERCSVRATVENLFAGPKRKIRNVPGDPITDAPIGTLRPGLVTHVLGVLGILAFPLACKSRRTLRQLGRCIISVNIFRCVPRLQSNFVAAVRPSDGQMGKLLVRLVGDMSSDLRTAAWTLSTPDGFVPLTYELIPYLTA